MSTTPKILTTSDVSLHTATIEVKVMKIGNRQVTLSVFRQLPERSVINHLTGDINGIPWGRVNYHVGCENNVPYAPYIPRNHLHIVWQLGNELYRSIVLDYTFGQGTRLRNDEYHTDEEMNVIANTWRYSYAQLEQLDQLFIAV